MWKNRRGIWTDNASSRIRKYSRKSYKRAYGRGGTTTTRGIAKKALKEVQRWKRQSEKKEILVNTNIDIGESYTWTIEAINLVGEGVSNDQRIGKKISMTSVGLHYLWVTNPTSTAVENQIMRIYIFYDRAPRGALAEGEDVFTTDTIYANLSRKEPYKGRFQILHTEYIIGTKGQTHLPGSIYINLKNKQAQYSAETGVIAAMQKGAILIAICQGAGDTLTNSRFYYNSRVMFTDT